MRDEHGAVANLTAGLPVASAQASVHVMLQTEYTISPYLRPDHWRSQQRGRHRQKEC